jgi:hypothetical protein
MSKEKTEILEEEEPKKEKSKKENKKSNNIIVTVVVLLLFGVFIGIGFAVGGIVTVGEINENVKVDCTTKEQKKSTDVVKDTKVESKTRVCSGTYAGKGTVLVDVNYKKTEGDITVILSEDGKFEIKKSTNGQAINGDAGIYEIYDDTIIFKATPHTSGPEDTGKYVKVGYATIDGECSSISSGYGSIFLDSLFTLKK